MEGKKEFLPLFMFHDVIFASLMFQMQSLDERVRSAEDFRCRIGLDDGLSEM